jgi:hypothetical protein
MDWNTIKVTIKGREIKCTPCNEYDLKSVGELKELESYYVGKENYEQASEIRDYLKTRGNNF